MPISDTLSPPFRQAWVVYEDDALLVVDKPAGLAVHPGDEPNIDLRSRLSRWREQRGQDGRLWLLHGLDQNASGLVLLSKDKAVNGTLAAQLEAGIERTLVAGIGGGGRARGAARREADRTLLQLTMTSSGGRSRRRLAAAGTPIAGDSDNDGPPAHRLMLHQATLTLRHPLSGERCHFEAPLPAALSRWLKGGERPHAGDSVDSLLAMLAAAASRRYPLTLDAESDCFRLLHGAGDGLPGVEIDRYLHYAVLRVHQDIAPAARQRLVDALALLGVAGVQLKVRPKRANVVADTRDDNIAPQRAAYGETPPEPLTVREHGVPYLARLTDGLSTGLFLDQRNGRACVRASSRGRRVLNLFAYHGAFTVAAVAGGARASITLDTSQTALEHARANLRAVGADLEVHQLVCGDALEWLQQAARRGERFDLIILDPPSYATTKQARFSAKRDYRTLASDCLRLLLPGGMLLACTNHRGIPLSTFRRWLTSACAGAERNVVRLEVIPCPPDHPASPTGHHHLKSILLHLR